MSILVTQILIILSAKSDLTHIAKARTAVDQCWNRSNLLNDQRFKINFRVSSQDDVIVILVKTCNSVAQRLNPIVTMRIVCIRLHFAAKVTGTLIQRSERELTPSANKASL
ncbi:MAG: hypothetical protein CMD54_04645 [Gammaproteobacteria bacterium]|nr:hypothetical protein [Gammaproteobacteria bacterium]